MVLRPCPVVKKSIQSARSKKFAIWTTIHPMFAARPVTLTIVSAALADKAVRAFTTKTTTIKG